MDQYDIVAVFLGVWFTLRKLDTQARDASQQPSSVAAADFERWRRQAVAAYTPGMNASFFRVLFHFGYMRYAAHHPLRPLTFARIALLVDAIWLVSVVTTLYRAHRSRELARKLGIVTQKIAPSP